MTDFTVHPTGPLTGQEPPAPHVPWPLERFALCANPACRALRLIPVGAPTPERCGVCGGEVVGPR